MTFTSIFRCNSRIVIFLFFYLVNLSFGFIKNDFNKSFIISQNFPSDDSPNNFGTFNVTSLCANRYSRNSPEMDLLISSINNPSWIHGPLYSNRPYTEDQIHKLMESLLKRKIHINDLKRVFYRPVIREGDYYDTEHIFVPPFRPDPHTSTPVDPLGKRGYLRDPFDKPYFAKDPFAKLRTTPKSRDGLEIVGRDIPFIKDGKVCIEKQKYSLEDVLAQTLVSALLEAEEITKFKSKIVKVPTQHPRVLRDSDNSKLVRGDSDDFKLVRGDSDDSKLVREILNDIVVFNKGTPFYIPNVDKEKFETAPGYDYQSFDRKLARNMTLLQELENNTNFSTLFKDILQLQEERSMDLWTQYLSNPLLSYLYKYSNEDKISKLPPDEVMADDLYMSIHLYKHKYLKSLAIKRQYELLNQYIKFNLKRKSTLKVMPYWIWREYWYDRENFYNSNLYEVLREIVITDPRIDLGKVTEGIFDYTNPVKRLNTFNVLSRPSVNNINKYINYAIDKYGQISPKIDQIKHLINSYSKDKLEPIDPFYNTNTINMNDIIDKLVQDYTKNDVMSTVDSLDRPGSGGDQVSNDPVLAPDPVLSPDTVKESVTESVKLDKNLLGYEFRNILSSKNFEEAYKKHNMKYFGTPDYSIKLGQLVKGKVFKVLKDKVIVDIHAHTLAELSLRNFFHSPAEVPMGGFTTLFKAGDELIFEIIELYDHKIEVSLKKIRQFHKYRKILENKHNVFLAKVLQRYQNGILVQYTENTINTIDTENTSATTDTAESGNTTDKSATENVTVDVSNTGFVKLKDLLDKYKNKRDVVDMNLVGQVIPVTFSEFFHVHNVPSLSNKDALKKLQVIYLREDDIIKGLVIKSTPYYLILKFGNLRGYLYVNDMNSETYKQHLITTPRNIIAQVKYINYRDGYVMLSNNDVYELSEDKLMRTNEFLAEFNKYSLEQNLEHYRKFMANYTHHKPTTTYTDTEQLVEWYLY